MLVDITELQKFLIERKIKLMEMEKHSKGMAKGAIVGQAQAIESILIFLSRPQEAANMASLQLTLEKQAKPIDELPTRMHTSEVVDALLELADKLKPGTHFPLNAPGIKTRSVVAKLYALKKKGRIPEDIVPVTRGKNVFIARKK